ncbi:Solute carrier family 13 member 5 [Sarcoptes scabiei]|uniref:Solute carrier family 13 member 5 n=1 Tax=Sarcoptes scabiei TaxID=52283 RepID=A0A131ZT42_SARSC|nr:Solute carrier family 13 member 5 [Sarcoptes scabiei]KPL97330.1 solute carrier family 13-like protein 2 [Sarcoptes scabiei]
MLRTYCSNLIKCKDGIITFITPLILSPLLLYSYDSMESRCAFVVLLMIIYWIFQPIPLAVTALLPVALFPLLGLADTEKACGPYLKSTNMLFMSSLIIAIAVESSNFHKRIAYKFLIKIGSDLRSLFAGFMLITMFLGIWIINTAATAMILPVADVVVGEIFDPILSSFSNQNQSMEQSIELMENHQKYNNDIENKNFHKKHNPIRKELEYVKRLLYICIAFSATIGGTTTLTSNGPNLVFQFVMDEFFTGVNDVDYTRWLLFCLPATILSVLSLWLFISIYYLRSKSVKQLRKLSKSTLIAKYEQLGSITFYELAVCSMFLMLIILWMFRDPRFLPGWARLLNHKIIPKDTTPAIFVVVLLFCIPSNPFGPYPSKSLLDWNYVQSKLAWGVILLRGGGFAVAETASSSGLATLIGKQLLKINQLPLWAVVISISFLASLTTELASNSAIASLFLPISGQLAMFLNQNPLLFIIPVTLSCSFAFVLPVGTPANALVATHAKLSPFDMLVPGLVAKILCTIIMFLNLYIVGVPTFDLNLQPDWINSTKLDRI